MDLVLQAQFQRVEAALSTLIESITSYNPSPQAALHLVAADEELTIGLEQLSTHQANHARILSLRHEAETLQTQIKSSLTTLAHLRKQLLATPATTFPTSSRSVPFTEILDYAEQISHFSVPPTHYLARVQEESRLSQGQAQNAEQEQAEHLTEPGESKAQNGVGDDTPSLLPATQSPAAATDSKGRAWERLLPEQKADLEWTANQPFIPWPSEDKIRAGNLGQIERMLQKGEDPSTVLPLTQQEEVERHQAEEEERQRMEREEREKEDLRRRESAYGGAPRATAAEQPAVFGGFDMYDDDDE